ncbi:PEP/pyruvate-binding domain-containing protein [Streptomyces sp. NPDC012508]|uniref:PEP/pyruvate-binding domain-containing protein n=1 Tax=Streptomyces sp. NPDC012508 TaxID=3364837 RepID=UPI0036C5DFAE
MGPTRRVVPFAELGRSDVGRVGGNSASPGEMANRLGAAGIRVPTGFATTAEAYEELLSCRGLRDSVQEHDHLHQGAPLDEVGAGIRSFFLAQPLPPPLRDAILAAYELLAEESGGEAPEVVAAAVKRHVARAETALGAARDEGSGDHAQEHTAPSRPKQRAAGPARAAGGQGGRAARSPQEPPGAGGGGERASQTPGTHHQGVDALPLNRWRTGRIASRGMERRTRP